VEDQTSLLQGNMQEDSFEVVMRGYNKRQVDDYVLQCQHHIRDLAQRLALAEQEIERVRADANAAIEKAASKPVHEEVSERLAQILRLANEEAERERAAAADEIAALRAQALTETQNLRDQAQRETESLRQQAVAETDAQRERAANETETLREQVAGEVDALRERAQQDAADELDRARSEAERLLTGAREAADRDVSEAHAAAQEVEETARSESERLMLAAQERTDALIGEAERRATAINTVLGSRLEILTTTHQDVVGRLAELRSTLVDVLGKEESLGAFEVPPAPSELPLHPGPSLIAGDPYVQTAGEVAAAYEAAAQGRTAATDSTVRSGRAGWHDEEPAPDDAHATREQPTRRGEHVLADEPAASTAATTRDDADPAAEDDAPRGATVDLDDEPDVTRPIAGPASGRRLDLTSVPDKAPR
jgi:cell division septum initiation protein DivIVA